MKSLKLICSASVLIILFAVPIYSQEDEWLEQYGKIYSLYSAGNYAEAVETAEEALKIAEKPYSPYHNKLFRSLKFLTILYKIQGNNSEAVQVCKRIVALRDTSFYEEHPFRTFPIDMRLYKYQGEYAEAESLFYNALVIDERELGKCHLCVGIDLINLAFIYDKQKMYSEAVSFYERAIFILETIVSPNHPHVAKSLDNLGELYEKQDELNNAESVYRRALSIREKNEPRNVILSKRKLARLLHIQGKYSEALLFFKDILEFANNQYQDSGVLQFKANILVYLVDVYKNLGKYNEAAASYKQILAIVKEAYGPDHRLVNRFQLELYHLYKDMGKVEEAEKLGAMLQKKGIIIKSELK